MEEKCLETFDLIELKEPKRATAAVAAAIKASPDTIVVAAADRTTGNGTDRVDDRSLHDILLNLPSTSRSSMSLLQEEEEEEDFGNSQHDFAEVLDEDTTTSGVLETFEISSSNSLPTCSDMGGDVAVVDDSSSTDAIKVVSVTGPSMVSTSRNNFFNGSEIYVINDDDDEDEEGNADDDDDDAVFVANEIESESHSDTIANISQLTTAASGDRAGDSQLNGVIMTPGGATVYLETPVVEEHQQQHHHTNNLINIVVGAAAAAGQLNYAEKAKILLGEEPEVRSLNAALAQVENVDVEDDDDDEENKELDKDQRIALSTDKNHKKCKNSGIAVPVSDAVAGNATDKTTESPTGRAKGELFSAEGNAERMSFRLKNMSINNTTPHDSTGIMSAVVGGSGVLDELPSGSSGLIAAPSMADMDLIERRDFETEQRLTGGIILKSSSLMNKNLLNLRLVKQAQHLFNKAQQEESASAVGRTFSSDSKCTYKEPQTTPTSSRNYNSRLTKSTAKLNMGATLSQQPDAEQLSGVCGLAAIAALPAVNAATTSSSPTALSTVIVEAPTTSTRGLFSSLTSRGLAGVPETYSTLSSVDSSPAGGSGGPTDRMVNVACLQREHVEGGCSRTSAVYSTLAATSSNGGASNSRTDDSEPSTSARCQYTPQLKSANGGVRQVHHASAQTNDRYLSRSAVPRAASPAVAAIGAASAGNASGNGIAGGNAGNLSLAAGLRNRRRLDAVPHLARNSTSDDMIAAFKVVVAEAAAAAAAGNFNEDDAWADCEENTSSDMEEICTCPHRSDSESSHSSNTTLNEEDFETPANAAALYRDGLDLPGYLQSNDDVTYVDTVVHDTSAAATATVPYMATGASVQQHQRKRKYNESRMLDNEYGGAGNGNCAVPNCDSGLHGGGVTLTVGDAANSRKRIAYDFTSTPRSSYGGGGCSNSLLYATPTATQMAVSPFGSPLGRRTPRSIIPTRDNPPPELQSWLTQFQRWTHAERLLAVDRLIEHCEPTQVRHMMKVIEPQFQRDFISLLPRELALQVLAYLDPKDLLRAAQTCRSWRFLCDDNLLWKEKCRKAQILTEPLCDRPKRGRAGNMPPIASPWKAAYMRQHIIEMNWRSRPIREPKVLKGHDEHVITCLQFSGNRIVSGSDDNTLKVWSAVTGRCLRTLVGHTGGVWSSQMSGNIIISGSTDRTLKVWDMETGMCVHTLMGHTSTVRCMHLHGKKVVSGSRDATLRVWDIEQGTCLHVLVGHLAAVRCVQYDGKLIVSGAYDYMVKIWHPERQECLHTLQGHTNRVYSLQFDGIHVVSGSLDTSIRVWDVETGNCKHTLMGHQSLTSGMELRQNILVSGNADSTVKVWDITTGQCLQTLSGPNKHQSAVTCLQFNSRFVVTSSDDGTVKLWDVKTGEFIRNLVSLESGGSGGVVWRIRANDTKLICAVGSRNGTEETKLLVLDFDVEGACVKCS